MLCTYDAFLSRLEVRDNNDKIINRVGKKSGDFYIPSRVSNPSNLIALGGRGVGNALCLTSI